MRRGRPPKPPLYTLPHGIEVIGEYAPNPRCPYWRVRVRPHPLIGGKVVSGGVYARRSTVVMAAHLGRRLKKNEHVHHVSGDKEDDRIENLRLLTAADHNTHHKKGTNHSETTKRKIGSGVRRAFLAGKMQGRRILRGEQQPMAKLDAEKVRRIRSCKKSAYSLAKEYGVSKQVVLSVRQMKTWRHIQ